MVIANRCFIIAEAGVNHNGSDALALELVAAAAAAGADAVKFQTFQADKLASASAPKADYQVRQTGDGDQLSMLRALELSEAGHRAVVARCAELDIEFMSTPFDEESALFLVNLGMRRIKVPSGELTNKPFITYLASFDLPLILSTGMATLAEVMDAIDWVREARLVCGFAAPLAERLTLLHCTSNYPAKEEDVNLRAMHTLAASSGLAVGYSDHTAGITISIAAVAMGACVIEKHFTTDRELPGPDHKASLEPDQLATMVSAIRHVESALGDGIKQPRAAELQVRDVARRSVTLAASLPQDHILGASDLILLRPGTGIAPKELSSVVGRRLARALPSGSTLHWDDLK